MSLSAEEIQNLSELFLSKDDTNTQLAFEIMEPHGFIESLVTEIFVVYKLTKSEELRQEATQLLEKFASPNIKAAMARRLEFNIESSIKKNISKYVSTSKDELDGLKFARALYNKYDKGFAYLMKEGSSDEKRAILEGHKEGTTFKLRMKGLTSMPNEFFEFTDLEEIDLRSNKIASVSAKFKVFKNLRKLDLAYNCLKKVHPSLASLDKLEDLNLSNNLIQEFPTVLGDLKALRRLNMKNMLNIRGLVRGVTLPENFFSLKLNYLGISGSNDHGFEQIPLISELETTGDNYIVLEPLAMAKQAFEAGQKSAVYYLLYYAESEYRKKVLESFYDTATKTMDLSGIYIKFLPKELADFDIKILNMKKSRYCYNFKLEESVDIGVKSIGELKNLEELYLDNNGFNEIPNPVFNCTKLRILSMHDNGKINKVQPEIKALQELEYLDLDCGTWDPIDFPQEMKTLKKLKEVKVSHLSHKTDEVKEAYTKHIEDIFGDRVALNYYGLKKIVY